MESFFRVLTDVKHVLGITGVAAGGPLLLSVGADEVRVTTAETTVTERKVPLPDRWLKGFGEVQALARPMRPVAELAGADAQRFLRSIPRAARRPLWAIPAGRSLTLATSPRPGAACLAGPHRLAELGPLLRFARGLRAYSAEADTSSQPMPSAWELDLGTARFTLTLSPEHYRGFTGEAAGGLRRALQRARDRRRRGRAHRGVGHRPGTGHRRRRAAVWRRGRPPAGSRPRPVCSARATDAAPPGAAGVSRTVDLTRPDGVADMAVETIRRRGVTGEAGYVASGAI